MGFLCVLERTELSSQFGGMFNVCLSMIHYKFIQGVLV